MFETKRAGAFSPAPAVVFLIGAVALTCATSCNSSSESKQDAAATATATDPGRCERLLNNALDGLRPGRLGIDSERKSTIDTLNQWVNDCGSADSNPYQLTDPAVLELIGKVSGPQQVEHINDKLFSGRDGLHVRTCFLTKKMSEYAGAKAANNLNRVVDLFEFVNRNIDLEIPAEALPPNTLYSAIFFGSGSPEDRAWLFASILKQLRIDAVILRPKSNPPDLDPKIAAKRWLVGVLLDGQVYLFDTRLGTPIPAPDDDGKSSVVRKPATLAEVKQHDELLRALDLPDGRAYPLKADDLKDLSVEVVGEISYWEPRMARLQTELAGRNSAIVYSPLEDRDGNVGALRRAAEAGAGNWDKSAVTLWPHPEVITEKFEARTPAQNDALIVRELPFQTHFLFPELKDIPPNEAPVGSASKEHRRGRTKQLVGDFSAAIGSYNKALIEERLKPEIEDILVRLQGPDSTKRYLIPLFFAAENATFWTGVTHWENGDQNAALNTLRKYKRRSKSTGVKGPWTIQCQGLIAQILAGKGQYKEAIDELATVPANDPKKDGYDLLAARWRKIAGLGTDKSKTDKPEPSKDATAAPSKDSKDAKAEPAKEAGAAPQASTPAPGSPAPAAPAPAEPAKTAPTETKPETPKP